LHQSAISSRAFSVGENILLEDWGGTCCGPIDYAAVHAEPSAGSTCWSSTRSRTPVARLNVAKMQLVEIAKHCRCARACCCSTSDRLMTPHETVVYSPAAQIARRRRLDRLRQPPSSRKCSPICDKVTVLRDGRKRLRPAVRWQGLGRRTWCD